MPQSDSNKYGWTQEEIDRRKRQIALKQEMGIPLTDSDWTVVNFTNGMRCHACGTGTVATSVPQQASNDPGFGQN